MKYVVCDAGRHPDNGAVVMTVVAGPFGDYEAAEAHAIGMLDEQFRATQRPATLHVLAQAGHVSSCLPTIDSVRMDGTPAESWSTGEGEGGTVLPSKRIKRRTTE